jgi:hypothetical protein
MQAGQKLQSPKHSRSFMGRPITSLLLMQVRDRTVDDMRTLSNNSFSGLGIDPHATLHPFSFKRTACVSDSFRQRTTQNVTKWTIEEAMVNRQRI